MDSFDIIIIGGGAAGLFAAAVLAEEAPELDVLVLEKAAKPLGKVRISGGGRCNLTHACSDLREFLKSYPRGQRELIGPFHRFGPKETVEWFEAHGVPLVTLEDGCLFPQSDTSEDVIRALLSANPKIKTHSEVLRVTPSNNGFTIELKDGTLFHANKVLVATGGGEFIEGLGQPIEPCVPSLFTFNTPDKTLTSLSGIVVENVTLSAAGLKASGALLITHQGISGPAVLRLSSFGARKWAEANYQFEARINWLNNQNEEQVFEKLLAHREKSPQTKVTTWSPVGLPQRLWKMLTARAGIEEQKWVECSHKNLRRLAAQTCDYLLPVSGRNRHHEEFVTCGGISLKEIDFKTMESKRTPGLYFAGEVLDIDALTGGFNLQAAWTTGCLAARAMQQS